MVRPLAAKLADKPVPTSAKQAVEEGLAAFNERKDYTEALRLFQTAMDLKPNDQEAIAALYNAGCAHAKRKEWKQAADLVLRAVNDYNMKLSVALAVSGPARTAGRRVAAWPHSARSARVTKASTRRRRGNADADTAGVRLTAARPAHHHPPTCRTRA